MARPREGKAAFSLIEVLVVISIIVVLLGILLPSLGAARRQSQKTACAAQLGQLGVSMQMYVDLYDSTYPDAEAFPYGIQFPPDITQHDNCVPARLHPLLPNTPTLISEVWYCPVKGAVPPPTGLRAMGHGTYPFNDLDFKAKKAYRITRPAAIGLLRDFVALDRITDDMTTRRFSIAHDNGQNILYADGHADFSKDQRFFNWGPTEHPEFPR